MGARAGDQVRVKYEHYQEYLKLIPALRAKPVPVAIDEWALSENRTEAELNPTGLLFKMYRDHFGTIPVEVSGDSPQPKPLYPAAAISPR